jgi:hypothetical protein
LFSVYRFSYWFHRLFSELIMVAVQASFAKLTTLLATQRILGLQVTGLVPPSFLR